MILHVGQPTLYASLERYARHFDLLELRAERGKLPRLAQLKKWRETGPRGFVFSVVLPIQTGGLEDASTRDAGASYAAEVAHAVQAQWIVLRTPVDVTPGRTSRERLSSLVAQLRGPGRRLAWEPRGPWAVAQAEHFATELGAVLVGDAGASEVAAGPVVYTRLRAIGSGDRVKTSAIERAAERLMGRSEALVVLEGRGGGRGATLLRELVTAGVANRQAGFVVDGPDDEDDEDIGDDEDDEEEEADE